MARSIMLPPGVTDLVRATGQPITITAVEFDNNQPVGTSAHVVFLDGDQVRSAPLGDWPAAQAELAQKEADKQQAAQVKAQILGALQGLTGRRADATFTNAEIKAIVMALVHARSGLNKSGEFKAPGEWL